MGRTREYDEDAVLAGAMRAFRRKGYFAVSIKDLEEATGLKGGSIYNSYGDKAGLFAAAFTHYNDVVLSRRIATYAPEAAGIRGLQALFLSLLHEPNGETFGCLITNSAIEFGGNGDGDAMPAQVPAALQTLLKTFTDRLAAASHACQLRSDIDASGAASKLLALYQGILVLVRAGHDKESLQLIIDDEFHRLEEINHVT